LSSAAALFHVLLIQHLRLAMFAAMFATAVRWRCMGPAIVDGVCWRWTTSIGCIPVSGVTPGPHVSSSVVPASSAAAEAMFTPAMAVAPMRPWAHAEEDTVIEISRPVKAAGCAAVRCVVVIAVGTDRRIYAYAYTDADLRTRRRH